MTLYTAFLVAAVLAIWTGIVLLLCDWHQARPREPRRTDIKGRINKLK